MDDFMSACNRNRRSANVMRVRDAKIEEIFRDRNAGYVTISYGVIGEFNIINIEVITLLVGQNTVIQNERGQELLLRDLEEGMSVDAEFSSAMTASIPPQARAYRITVLREDTNWDTNVKVDRIMEVDAANRYFITGNPRDINNQIRFNVAPETILLDRRGNRIMLSDLRPGQMVRVEHASFMTFSIPPQTTAYVVQVL